MLCIDYKETKPTHATALEKAGPSEKESLKLLTGGRRGCKSHLRQNWDPTMYLSSIQTEDIYQRRVVLIQVLLM